MESNIGLIVQLNGIFLIIILSLFLRRSLKLVALKYWTIAWLALSFSLISLRLAVDYPQMSSMLFTYYFLGEYIFGYMLVTGIRSLDEKFEFSSRAQWIFVPFVIVSIALPLISRDFYTILPFHTLFLSVFAGLAFYWLNRLEHRTIGWHVMRATLALMTLNFVSFFALELIQTESAFAKTVLSYNYVINMVVQTALGFGMVIVLLEKVLSDFQRTNTRLEEAHKRLETLVHTDPLTAAFNRHAFYGFVRRSSGDEQSATGCVGFFDIDGLKNINDCFGHSAGDSAIRLVVRSIRDIIRAEDLIYRWGGDEFFVIMVGMDAEMAETRMARLQNKLKQVSLDGVAEPLDIGVSWGFKNFTDMADLENSINEADAKMYEQKRLRKTVIIDFPTSPHEIAGSGGHLY